MNQKLPKIKFLKIYLMYNQALLMSSQYISYNYLQLTQ